MLIPFSLINQISERWRYNDYVLLYEKYFEFSHRKKCDLLNVVRPVVFNLEWREPVEEGGLCNSIECGNSYFM